jgi:hypothetical protein
MSAAIQNMYEVMPKMYTNQAFNPNFDLHGISLPFRMCVAAPSGSGKSNFTTNLVRVFSQGRVGTFSKIFIITRNADEPLYNWLKDVAPDIIISEGIDKTPALDSFDKKENGLLIWDDLIMEKKLTAVEEAYIRARNRNVSCVFISQSYYKIPKIIRQNCTFLVLLKLGGAREIVMIMSEHGLGVTREKLLAIYQHATSAKLAPLLIDLAAPIEAKFRKGFEVIDIDSI